jgi:hypothetical protein
MTLIDVHTVVSRSYWYLLVVINVFMALIGSRSLKTERFDWLFRFYANSAGESTSTHSVKFSFSSLLFASILKHNKNAFIIRLRTRITQKYNNVDKYELWSGMVISS